MLFHRADFLVFFAVVWLIYSALGKKAQNWLLLAASVYFYASWDWRFLSLLFITCVVDYWAGVIITRYPAWKFQALLATLATNLTMLGFFKYFDFFTGSLNTLFQAVGFEPDLPTLGLLVPAGLSFYTFQSMSYTIDVYRGKTKACLHFPTFSLYVMYFPHMVAGPIQRAPTLIPQLEQPRRLTWEMTVEGSWFFLQGLFKKVAIADLCAEHVDKVFSGLGQSSLVGVLGSSVSFLFQLYADFSGYTDCAVGASLLLGIRLSRSFRQPLLSTSLSDFWRRWNMTVTSWFREYLYEPLRGSATRGFRPNFATVTTFVLIGLWHGASWTWALWGVVTGLMILAERSFGRTGPPLPTHPGLARSQAEAVRLLPPLKALGYAASVIAAFFMVAIPAVFAFRLGRLADLDQIRRFGTLADLPSGWNEIFPWVNMAFLMVVVEAYGESRNIWPTPRDYPALMRILIYLYFCLAILSAGGNIDAPYVYFQF